MNLVKEVDKLYQRYEYLQNLYYDMYIESYIAPIYPDPEPSWGCTGPLSPIVLNHDAHRAARPCGAIHNVPVKLYLEFKYICTLLSNIKMLLEDEPSSALLGSEEINALLSYKDIKTFFDNNGDMLYPVIDGNYEA